MSGQVVRRRKQQRMEARQAGTKYTGTSPEHEHFKVTPNNVMILSVSFIAMVIVLHIFGKIMR